jgi:hypothetical protein
MANFHLFAANVNGKRTFVSLADQRYTVIDVCCFSKRAHLQYGGIRVTYLKSIANVNSRRWLHHNCVYC